jgi:hypothetical protein
MRLSVSENDALSGTELIGNTCFGASEWFTEMLLQKALVIVGCFELGDEVRVTPDFVQNFCDAMELTRARMPSVDNDHCEKGSNDQHSDDQPPNFLLRHLPSPLCRRQTTPLLERQPHRL